MHLTTCNTCDELMPGGSCVCPHCGHKSPCGTPRLSVAALVLGLAVGPLGGCLTAQPVYGVAFTDDDGDGWALEDGDCDDDDDTIHPEAEETPGDGIDSNCDGEDDT